MKPLNYTLIKITLCFLAGVILGFYIQVPFRLLLIILGSIFGVFAVAFFVVRNQFLPSISFGIITFVLFFVIGFFVTKFHSPHNQPDHYINHISLKDSGTKDRVVLLGKVVEILNSNQYAARYIVELNKIEKQTVQGKILLNVAKDSTEQLLSVDDKLVLKSNLTPIRAPRNPHQFNYSTFMKNRRVFRQVHASNETMLVLKKQQNSLLGRAENIRNQIVSTLKANGFSDNQLAMVQALLLGQTQDITDETYDNYAAAGVIHILSVSGLHVGFVLFILDFLFRPLERFKFGKILKVVLLILLLWGFALLAGFSSPVVRSVTMFSFVAVGLNWGRKTHILNILCMSLFAILLFAPNFIFEIGFKLSYLAVFSIVIFQPIFYKLYRPRWAVDKVFWGTLTVTMAAQIGVVPLSLYYFHQFPGLFFLSNLLVVPYVGIILGIGLLVIVLAFFNLLPTFLAQLFGDCIDLLNWFVAWCAEQKTFLFQNIHFSVGEMLASYLLVFCLSLLVWKFSYKKMVACGISVFFLLGVFLYEKREITQSNQFLVFDKSRKTMLGFQRGKQLNVAHNIGRKHISEEYSIRNFMIGEAIKEISSDPLKNIYPLKNNFLLVVDSAGVYQLPKLQNSLVLLRNSPKVNLDRLIELLHPKAIIADRSNYYSYIDRWRETCCQHGIPFHYTGKKGAFIMDLSTSLVEIPVHN